MWSILKKIFWISDPVEDFIERQNERHQSWEKFGNEIARENYENKLKKGEPIYLSQVRSVINQKYAINQKIVEHGFLVQMQHYVSENEIVSISEKSGDIMFCHKLLARTSNYQYSIDEIIKNKLPISSVVPDALVFKRFYLSEYHEVNNPKLLNINGDGFKYTMLKHLLKREQCSNAYCDHVENIMFEKTLAIVLFFENDIGIAIQFETNIVYCVIKPVVEEAGLASIDKLSENIAITSLIAAIGEDKNPNEVISLILKTVNLIVSDLIMIKHPD